MENTQPTYGFTEEMIRQLKDENDNAFNPELTLKNICIQVFRSERIRTLDELIGNKTDAEKHTHGLEVQNDIIRLCSKIVTVCTPKKVRIPHEKGDPKTNDNGEKIVIGTDNAGMPIYDTWDSKGVETRETFEESPFWNPKQDVSRERLKKQIQSQVVQPNIEIIKERMCPDDLDESMDIIKKITNYYTFEDPDLFVKGFCVLASNAKAKALNHHPEWPIMLAIVGQQGLGKGWLREAIADTYDEVFDAKSEPANFKAVLASDFNTIMQTRGFLKFDEKNGLNQEEVETLKTFITEKEVLINQKHKDTYSITNLTTFLAMANETIKGVMQWQKDRRIVECNLVGRNGRYPEDELKNDLRRLWRIIPISTPFDAPLKDRLIAESEQRLDTKMIEIVYGLFEEHQNEFVSNNSYIVKWKFENTIKGIKGIKVQAVVDWCEEKGVFKKQKNGSYTLSKRGYSWLLDEYNKLVHQCDISDKEEE